MELFQLALPAQHGRAPYQAQVDTEGGRGGTVPGHIAHDHVGAAVVAAHHIAEVTAQQSVRATRRVVEGGREAVRLQRQVGQQAPFQQGVVPRDLLARHGAPRDGTLQRHPDLPGELVGSVAGNAHVWSFVRREAMAAPRTSVGGSQNAHPFSPAWPDLFTHETGHTRICDTKISIHEPRHGS